jgi:PAS domain-containing protein
MTAANLTPESGEMLCDKMLPRNLFMMKAKSGLTEEIDALRRRLSDLERERETVELERRERLRGEERYRVVADATGQVIYDCDVPTRHIEWAGRVEDITGYTREEFNRLGIPGWRERLHPEDRARRSDERQNAISL